MTKVMVLSDVADNQMYLAVTIDLSIETSNEDIYALGSALRRGEMKHITLRAYHKQGELISLDYTVETTDEEFLAFSKALTNQQSMPIVQYIFDIEIKSIIALWEGGFEWTPEAMHMAIDHILPVLKHHL